MREKNKSKHMNEKYCKEGCFFFTVQVLDYDAKEAVAGDCATGLPAIAASIARLLNKTPAPVSAYMIFCRQLKEMMENDDEN